MCIYYMLISNRTGLVAETIASDQYNEPNSVWDLELSLGILGIKV